MNFQIKVLRGLDRGNYVIVITRGSVNIVGFNQLLDKVADATQPPLDCKVLIDFQDSTFHFLPSDVTEFVASFDVEKWPHNNKVALVASSEVEQYRWLAMLRDALSKAQREVGVFCDTREAMSWLADVR